MISAWVIDASVLAAYLLREPDAGKMDTILQQVIEGTAELHAPSLLVHEMTNILITAERRKRITRTQRTSLLSEWELIPISEHAAPSPQSRQRIVALADQHHLSGYDAAYVELAERLQAKLLSLDTDILRLKKAYRWIF